MDENLEHIRELFERLEDRFSKRMDKVEDKIDKLADISAANAVKLAENTSSLVDHMRRTEILEEELKTQKTNLEELEDNIDFMVKFPKYLFLFGKWVAGIGAAAATIYSVIKLFKS